MLTHGFAANRATERHAVESRQHQVEDDQVERLVARQGQAFGAIAGLNRDETLQAQV